MQPTQADESYQLKKKQNDSFSFCVLHLSRYYINDSGFHSFH